MRFLLFLVIPSQKFVLKATEHFFQVVFFFQKLFVYKQFIRSLAKPVSVNFVQYYFWIFLGFHVIEILYQILTKSQCLSYEDLRVRSAH